MDLDANLDPAQQHRLTLIRFTQQISSTYQDESLIFARLREAYTIGRKQGRVDAFSTVQNPTSI